jgi:hypothetical protein
MKTEMRKRECAALDRVIEESRQIVRDLVALPADLNDAPVRIFLDASPAGDRLWQIPDHAHRLCDRLRDLHGLPPLFTRKENDHANSV